MHEVIGHASGKISERLKGSPQTALKEQYSALEESRADLVALYFLPDPKLVELGLVEAKDHDEIVQAEYEGYTRNALVQLRRIREGTQIEEDHMRNRQMIVRWLMANSKAIEVRERDGKTFYVMVDAKAFQEGVGRLLAEVQRIKAEGDYDAAVQAVRDLRRPLRCEAARRGRRPRRSPQDAVLHRLRAAAADGDHGRRRPSHRREDLVSAGSDDADAGVFGPKEVGGVRRGASLALALVIGSCAAAVFAQQGRSAAGSRDVTLPVILSIEDDRASTPADLDVLLSALRGPLAGRAIQARRPPRAPRRHHRSPAVSRREDVARCHGDGARLVASRAGARRRAPRPAGASRARRLAGRR